MSDFIICLVLRTLFLLFPMLQLVVPFLLHCIGKVLFWKPLAMSCVVKNPSHPERETWTCGTMTSNVVLSLLVMRCWIIKAKFWSWSWGLQKRKVLKSHLWDVFKPMTNFNSLITLKLNQMHLLLVTWRCCWSSLGVQSESLQVWSTLCWVYLTQMNSDENIEPIL